MYGASTSTLEANSKFKATQGFPFPLLCDLDRSLSLAFGTVNSAKDGIAARYTFVIGADGVIEKAIATKNPAGQAEELAAMLETLSD